MRAVAYFLSLVLLSCTSKPPVGSTEPGEVSPPPVELQVGEPAKVYRGAEGLTVTMVPVLGGEMPRALIEISGVSSEIANVVLLYEKVPAGSLVWAYRTTLAGVDYSTVWRREPRTGAEVDVYLPGSTRVARRVHYDEKASSTVDGEALARRHAAQLVDGTIAELQRFHRDEYEKDHDQRYDASLATARAACKAEIPGAIDWTTISDDALKRYNITSFCSAITGALHQVCAFPAGREAVHHVRELRCELGDTVDIAEREDGVLTWIVNFDTTNLSARAHDLLRAHLGRDRIVLQAEDGRFYLTLDPGDGGVPVHYSEDGQTFFEHAEARGSSLGYSRQLFAAGANARLRFHDEQWRLSCDDIEVSLRELNATQAGALLASAELGGHRWQRLPYVLSRDDHGRYYYIDRLRDRYGGKGFRVFKGLKGELSLTRLVDIVDDTNGTIFATEAGNLRLLIDRRHGPGQATWYRGEDRTDLQVLPIAANLKLVFQELGVYAGESLGSVCELVH
jgi:hypothetical protein